MEFSDQLERVQALQQKGEYLEALDLLENILANLTENNRSKRIICYNVQCECLWRIGEFEKALSQARKALQLAQQEPIDRSGEGMALLNLGFVNWRKGNLEAAEEYLSKSLTINAGLRNPQATAWSLNALGLVYWHQGKLQHAEDFFSQSSSLFEESGNLQDKARSLNNLALVYGQKGELERAKKYFQRGIILFEQIDDPQGTSYATNNLGTVYTQQGELERAIECYEKCFELNVQIGNPQDIAKTLRNLGIISRRQGNVVQAKEFLKQSIHFLEDIANPLELSIVHYELFCTLLAEGALNEAVDQIKDLELLAQSSDLLEVAIRHEFALALLKLDQGDLSDALNKGYWIKTQVEEIPHFDLIVEAIQFLIEVQLRLYLFTEQEEHVILSEAFLQELEQLCKREHLHGTYVESIFTQGLLKRAKMELKEGFDLLQRAELLAEERGIRALAIRARNELSRLQKQLDRFKQLQGVMPHAYEQSKLQEVLEYLQQVRQFAK